jgi:hypothetical protein
MGGRKRIPLPADPQLAFVQFPPDLSARLAVLVGLGDVLLRRGVRSGRDLIRIISVEARLDAFFLGEPGQLVIVEMLRRAAVLPAVAVESLVRRIWELLGHRASWMPER